MGISAELSCSGRFVISVELGLHDNFLHLLRFSEDHGLLEISHLAFTVLDLERPTIHHWKHSPSGWRRVRDIRGIMDRPKRWKELVGIAEAEGWPFKLRFMVGIVKY